MGLSLSPSSAYRWISCPGSEYVIRSLPRLPSSPAAEEGSLAHEYAAYGAYSAIKEATGIEPLGGAPKEPELALADDRMLDGVRVYADAIVSKIAEVFGSRAFKYMIEGGVERHVQKTETAGGYSIMGRVDFAAWTEDAVIVADYKFGGEPVQAFGNPQLTCYAMCIKPNAERVAIGIIQPRSELSDFSQGELWQDLNREQFVSAIRDVEPHAIEACNADEKTLRKTGGHCRWCPARSVCRAAIGERLLLAGIAAGEAEMSEDATDEQIGAWLDALKGIDTIRDDLTRIAKARIVSGALIPGWHMQQRKCRTWSKEITDIPDVREQAKLIADAVGGDPCDYISVSLKTPSAVAKTVPKERMNAVISETLSSALVSEKR